MNRIAIALAGLLVSGFSPITVSGVEQESIIATSLVALIANPEQYNGKIVQVTGYYERRFEHSALFLTREGAQVRDIGSSVWIELPSTSRSEVVNIRSGFVVVIGRFYEGGDTGAGHLGLWRSAIKDVVFLQEARKWRSPVDILEVVFLLSAFGIALYSPFSRKWSIVLLSSIVLAIIWGAVRFVTSQGMATPPSTAFVVAPFWWVVLCVISRIGNLLVRRIRHQRKSQWVASSG